MVSVVWGSGSTGRKAIWLDGYLPTESEMVDVIQTLPPADQKYLENRGSNDPALLFQNLANIVKGVYHKQAEEAEKAKTHLCELFVV